MILVTNRQRKIPVSIKYIEQVVQEMLICLGYADFDIGILLTTNVSIRKFNAHFRGKDKATDILSFPFHPEVPAGKRIKVCHDEDKNLGDIIISLEYVVKKAPDFGRSFEEHLVALLAHGIAHLLNYDHITDQDYAIMQKVEKKLLRIVSAIKK